MQYTNSRTQNDEPSAYAGVGQVVPATEESASRIRDGISRAEQNLSHLHDCLMTLEKRLDTVLSPVPPTTAGNTAAGASINQPISHLLGRIQILNDGFEHAAQRVRDLTRRVEV